MEALTNEKETIDPPYYLKVEVPIGLFLLFFDRRDSADGLMQKIRWTTLSVFLIPTIVGVLLAASSFAGGAHFPAALISFGPCVFVVIRL